MNELLSKVDVYSGLTCINLVNKFRGDLPEETVPPSMQTFQFLSYRTSSAWSSSQGEDESRKHFVNKASAQLASTSCTSSPPDLVVAIIWTSIPDPDSCGWSRDSHVFLVYWLFNFFLLPEPGAPLSLFLI